MCASACQGVSSPMLKPAAQLRGNGTFSNLWTLSVILGSTTRSRQHGIEVRAGSLVIHRPGVEHDGIYGRNFKVACFTVHDDVLANLFPQLAPHFKKQCACPGRCLSRQPTRDRKSSSTLRKRRRSFSLDPQVRNSRRRDGKVRGGVGGRFPGDRRATVPGALTWSGTAGRCDGAGD